MTTTNHTSPSGKELKPCPFCGSDEVMDMRYSGDARIQCAGCNCSTDTYGHYSESHSAWNSRIAANTQSIGEDTASGAMEEVDARFMSGFLSDAMTAAGLVSSGKQSKALASRLAEGCMNLRMHLAVFCRKGVLVPPPNDMQISFEPGVPNQCDGCNVSAPLSEHGNHVMPDGGYMGCTRDRYVQPAEPIGYVNKGWIDNRIGTTTLYPEPHPQIATAAVYAARAKDSKMTTKNHTAPIGEREAFEARAKAEGHDLERYSCGYYIDIGTVWLWEGWEARAALIAEKVAAEPVLPDELHPDTAKLVSRFAVALGNKLLAAQRKYGYSDNWQRDDWADECRAELMRHIQKGDPRDVAAYCAFLWHHSESTSAPQQTAQEPSNAAQVAEEAARIADSFTCGTCGMDGKAGARIRKILGAPTGSVVVHHGGAHNGGKHE